MRHSEKRRNSSDKNTLYYIIANKKTAHRSKVCAEKVDDRYGKDIVAAVHGNVPGQRERTAVPDLVLTDEGQVI